MSDRKATLVAMWDAIENGDLERYASHLHPDVTSFGESDVYLNSGKQYEVRNIGDYLQRAHGVHTEMHLARLLGSRTIGPTRGTSKGYGLPAGGSQRGSSSRKTIAG